VYFIKYLGGLIMPTIRPISDLRNNFTYISDVLHNENEPIFLTKNGVGDMVVMSIDLYEQQLAKIELYEKLEEARNQINNGAIGKNAKDVILNLLKNEN